MCFTSFASSDISNQDTGPSHVFGIVNESSLAHNLRIKGRMDESTKELCIE